MSTPPSGGPSCQGSGQVLEPSTIDQQPSELLRASGRELAAQIYKMLRPLS